MRAAQPSVRYHQPGAHRRESTTRRPSCGATPAPTAPAGAPPAAQRVPGGAWGTTPLAAGRPAHPPTGPAQAARPLRPLLGDCAGEAAGGRRSGGWPTVGSCGGGCTAHIAGVDSRLSLCAQCYSTAPEFPHNPAPLLLLRLGLLSTPCRSWCRRRSGCCPAWAASWPRRAARWPATWPRWWTRVSRQQAGRGPIRR